MTLFNYIFEGGAAGHMKGPQDLPIVNTGSDLVNFFEDLVKALHKDEKTFIKIDGINSSIRLNEDNEFVLDRMSMKDFDVKGMKKEDMIARFGAGHGFLRIGPVVLDIFNEAIPQIKPELEKLGLWNDPTKMFNIEFVEGTTNVIETDKKFLAIHGLLQIEQITPRKRGTHEISCNKAVLDKLVEKLNPIADKFGFAVYTQFPAILDTEPNFKKVLSQKINIDGEKDSLENWIKKYNSGFDKSKEIKSKTKGKIAVLSKYVMQYVLNHDVFDDEFSIEDRDDVIKGFLLYYCTMVLGAELLRCINSDLGRGDTQEGIVIRNVNLTGVDAPCKITGNFILNGMASNFRRN